MHRWLVAAGLGLACLTGARAAPLDAYGQLPSMDNVVISPDGTALAYSTVIDGKTTVLIGSIDDRKPLGVLNVGDQKLRGIAWAGNDNVLITISVTAKATGLIGPRREYSMVQSLNLTTHRQRALLENKDDAMNIVLGQPDVRTINGDTVVFLEGFTFPSHIGVAGLFTVDLNNNATRLVQTGTERTDGWFLDDTGRAIAEQDYIETDHNWVLKLHHGDFWQDAFSTNADIDTPQVLGIGPEGKALLVAALDAQGEWVTRPLSLSDGTWGAPLDLGEGDIYPVSDPATTRIIGTENIGAGISYRFFDHADQLAWNSIAHAFGDESVELVTWSADRSRVVVRVDGQTDGASYYLIDQNKHTANIIGSAYRDIGPGDVAAVKQIVYAAADGMEIPAYLTLPNGRDPKNLPLVVLAHGGPAARDLPQFDWWAQALAAQGYAVLQPEFRGSEGFGWHHLTAGFGEWGRKMQTDLSDGVRFLAGQGTIDPKRVCIVGASYGGYAALAGPTLDRGVYRCAVSVAGISDPRDMLKWEGARARQNDNRTLRYWARFMGGTVDDEAKLAEISPLAHAAGADAPILLIHGTDDTVVPIEQSEAMEQALRAAGKPVNFVKLDGEDHWLSRAETRLQMLKATVDFLQANNPP